MTRLPLYLKRALWAAQIAAPSRYATQHRLRSGRGVRLLRRCATKNEGGTEGEAVFSSAPRHGGGGGGGGGGGSGSDGARGGPASSSSGAAVRLALESLDLAVRSSSSVLLEAVFAAVGTLLWPGTGTWLLHAVGSAVVWLV